jgi:aspartate aminotransferase
MPSLFSKVPYVPPDAIFELTKLYNADPSPRKVNLGQGTYKDENGQPWILPAVAAAKEKVQDANHEYLPILGLAEFRARAVELLLGNGAEVIEDGRVCCSSLIAFSISGVELG